MSAKALVVARTEYLKAVRSKAFVIGVLLMPLLMGGSFIALAISEKAKDTQPRSFAVVDRTGGMLWHALESAAQERNDSVVFEPGPDGKPGKQVRPRFVPQRVDSAMERSPAAGDDASPGAGDDSPGAGSDMQLSERVRSGDIFGFVILGADLPLPRGGDGEDREFSWQTETPTYNDLPDWIENVVNSTLRTHRLAQAGLDQALVDRLSQRENLREMGLAQRTASGEVRRAEESDKAANFGVPLVLTLLLFMLVMSTAPALLNAVLEEKMQKIAEVLVATVPPFDLMLGKLLAAVGMTLTLSLIYVGAGMLFVNNASGLPPQVAAAITPRILMWFALFQVMALLIYGSIFAAIGASCSEMQDAQSLMGPMMLLLMFPMFFLGPVLQSPDSTMSRLISLFPPATPILMMLRIAVPPGPDWWELVLAVALTVLFTAACVWAGGKIFRIGILSQGQTPTWRRLAQWVMSK